jgi:hypothetical protein
LKCEFKSTFSPSRVYDTHGTSLKRSMTVLVSSVEALSETTSWKSLKLCASALSTAPASHPDRLYVGMKMVTRGGMSFGMKLRTD